MVYQRMLELQKVIKTETFVDEINTEYVIGATMRVKLENYDALINKYGIIYHLKKYFP